MPRVLRLINRFNIGGPTFNAAYLSKYLAPEYETLLVGGQIDESEKESLHIINEMGLDYITVPTMHRSIDPYNDYKAYLFIDKLIKSFKPDIVHTHASKAGALGRIAASNNGVKVIVHTFHGHVFHSYFPKWKTTMYKSIERWLAKKSHCIVAISPIQKEEISVVHKIAPPSKVKVVPLGFDLDKFSFDKEGKRKAFRKKYSIDDDTVAIGIIGRLVPIKNHQLFLESLQYLLNNTEVKWKAFIVGDGESRGEIENKARSFHLKFSEVNNPNDHIHFTSFLTEIDWVMAGLDIVALSSKNEGTPVSLIEAQAAGKAILTTDVGGVRDVVEQDSTALLSEANDSQQFNKNLKLLVESPEIRTKFELNGPDSVKAKFDYRRLVKDMNFLYRSLLQ